MKKVIRDGKVAVIFAPDYGCGWSTWGKEPEKMMFDPELVGLIESGDEEAIELYCQKKYGMVPELDIFWVPEGEEFVILEYDGSEGIQLKKDFQWFKA